MPEGLQSFLTPAVLAFLLGGGAAWLRSDLRFPTGLTQAMSLYLLLAIGLKGGHAIREGNLATMALPMFLTIVLGVITPVLAFVAVRRLGKFRVLDAAAVAAHYGSVSVVTYTAAQLWVTSHVGPVEGYMPALVAGLEVPGILVALAMAQRNSGDRWRQAIRPLLTSKSVVLLVGGLLIGGLASSKGLEPTKPVFEGLFPGVLVLYMLDLGQLAVERIRDLKGNVAFVVGFGVAAPPVFGLIGILFAKLSGMSVGGASVMGAMAASASYIAAPTAVRMSMPGANLSPALAMAVGVTFPFNLLLGIPLYAGVAQALYR